MGHMGHLTGSSTTLTPSLVTSSNSTGSLIGAGCNGQLVTSPTATTSSRSSQEQLADKYGRKYNLISFILLRKNDEYLVNEKFYFNDQYNYERVDYMVDQLDLTSLMSLFATPIDHHIDTMTTATASTNTPIFSVDGSFSPSPTRLCRLADYVNSYNCSIFVYTIRKLVEKWASFSSRKSSTRVRLGLMGSCDDLKAGGKQKKNKHRLAIARCIKFMFSREIRPSSYFLIDGDFPRRNVMHYAARYATKKDGKTKFKHTA